MAAKIAKTAPILST